MRDIDFLVLGIQCLFMATENNYQLSKKDRNYLLSIDEINKITLLDYRPTIGLHVCCGPCSTVPLEFLAPYFKIVVLYTNSNIYPSEEYIRRFSELKRYITIFNEEHNQDVECVEFDYKPDEFLKKISVYKEQKEGQDRCLLCYRLRMNQAYEYANQHAFDYFTTVMTISRQKNAKLINNIGLELEKNYKTKYFVSDFKRHKGIDRAIELRKKYNLYNQEYCGCVYSFNARDSLRNKR